ncbi:MAG: TIGR01777 family protein, partial [Planctomycetes bacterium]|nr:TIGR01777 family protein [Planctomycetota bacterium]
MAKRVIIAGATGFLGRSLCRALQGDYELIALSRDAVRATGALGPCVRVMEWDARTAGVWAREIQGAQAIINLAGENLAAGRWTPARKSSILQSRTSSAGAIVDAVGGARFRPAVVIQASGVGYYGSRGDELLDEDATMGGGFLADVCRRMESVAAQVERSGVRCVVLRSGLVLDRAGGVLPRFVMPYRFFIGGSVGNGRQWLSWISLEDEVRAIRFLIENPTLTGAFNLTAPNPVTMRQFSHTLGQVLRRPAWTVVPAFVLRLALGSMAEETLLASQKTVPRRLREAGFTFRHPELSTALVQVSPFLRGSLRKKKSRPPCRKLGQQGCIRKIPRSQLQGGRTWNVPHRSRRCYGNCAAFLRNRASRFSYP